MLSNLLYQLYLSKSDITWLKGKTNLIGIGSIEALGHTFSCIFFFFTEENYSKFLRDAEFFYYILLGSL